MESEGCEESEDTSQGKSIELDGESEEEFSKNHKVCDKVKKEKNVDSKNYEESLESNSHKKEHYKEKNKCARSFLSFDNTTSRKCSIDLDRGTLIMSELEKARLYNADIEEFEDSLLPYSVESGSRTSTVIIGSVNQSVIGADEINIELVKRLGSGREGIVYLARLTSFDEYIALKQFEIKSDKDRYTKIVKTLYEKMQLVKSLNHPNILKYYSLRKSNNQKLLNTVEYHLLMEYMDGESLAKAIKEKKKGFSKAKIKKIMKQVLSGLVYLHSNNIIHRDLKPENILTNKAFDIFKIADFGISTQVKEHTGNVKRTCVGTPWYMAPEVILNQPYSYAADIWSFGCLCFELFCGKKPYDCYEGIMAMFLTVKHGFPIDYAGEMIKKMFYSSQNASILDFLKQCCSKKPENRPKAEELLKHKFFKKSVRTSEKEVKKNNQKDLQGDTKEDNDTKELNKERKEKEKKAMENTKKEHRKNEQEGVKENVKNKFEECTELKKNSEEINTISIVPICK